MIQSCIGAVVRLNKILQCPGLKQRQLCVAQAMFSVKQLINGVERSRFAEILHPCCVLKGHNSSIPRRKNVGILQIYARYLSIFYLKNYVTSKNLR